MKTSENNFDRAFRKQLIEAINILGKGNTPIMLESYRLQNGKAKAGARQQGYKMECMYCAEAFEAKSRNISKYCSDTCRTAAYRARKVAKAFVAEKRSTIIDFLDAAIDSTVTKP